MNGHRLKTHRVMAMRRIVHGVFAIGLCSTVAVLGDENEIEHFMDADIHKVAFPDAKELPESDKPISIQKGEWFFSVTQERDQQILSAKSADKLVTQSITPNAVFKRFVFDVKKQRFEPMRQEIRIEHASERKLQEIEGLIGVTAVTHYENLGFSIVKISAEVNPVEVFRVLKDDFVGVKARILSGFFEDEPM